MHPKKTELLLELEESVRDIDESLKEGVHVLMHPGEYGWRQSLVAGVLHLPLMGVSATLLDFSGAMLTRSSDETWALAFPDTAGPDHDRTT